MEWIIAEIKELKDKEFTGRLEISFFKGGIAGVDKHEHKKPPNNWKTEIAVRLVKP